MAKIYFQTERAELFQSEIENGSKAHHIQNEICMKQGPEISLKANYFPLFSEPYFEESVSVCVLLPLRHALKCW